MRKLFFFILVLVQLAPGMSFAKDVDSIIQKGIDHYVAGRYEDAIKVLSDHLAGVKGDKRAQKVIYNNLGNSYSNTGKVEKALECYEKAINLAEETGDKRSAGRIIKNLGTIYSENKDFDKALKQYKDAEAISSSIKDTANLADCANNKALIYEQQKNYGEALKEYNKALQLYQQLGQNDRIAILYNNLGIVYKYLKDYDRSIGYYQQSMETGKKLDDKFLVAANQINIGNVYELKGDYNKAIASIKAGLETGKEINATELMMEAYNSLAENYSKSGDYKTGFEQYKTYTTIRDSFINVERSKQMAEMQTKYETAKKEKQIAQQENEITGLEKTRYKMAAVIASLVLILVIAYLIYNRQQTRQRQAYEKAVLDAEYRERIRIAKDVHDDLGSGLSKISLMAAMAQNRPHTPDEVKLDITRISSVSKDLVGNMRDLIWILNPENTTLDNLVARLREYCADYLEGFPIDTKLDFPEYVPIITISRDAQHNILSTVKEAVNNCVKHSGATAVSITVKLTDTEIDIFIKDNGKGFIADQLKGSGNGLRNMRFRIESINGKFDLTSTSQGTALSITASIQALRANVKNTTFV